MQPQSKEKASTNVEAFSNPQQQQERSHCARTTIHRKVNIQALVRTMCFYLVSS